MKTLIILFFPFLCFSQIEITSVDDISKIVEGKEWVLDTNIEDPLKLAELSFEVDQALEKREGLKSNEIYQSLQAGSTAEDIEKFGVQELRDFADSIPIEHKGGLKQVAEAIYNWYKN